MQRETRTVARCTSDAAEHLWMIHTAAIYNEHRPQRAPPTTSTAHNVPSAKPLRYDPSLNAAQSPSLTSNDATASAG